jgi:FkbM family methyltransferase
MLTDFLKGKLERALEAADLSMHVCKDLHSFTALMSCYAGITRNPNDRSEVSFDLQLSGDRFPITMRKSDIFTLAEIFFDRQYAIHSPLPAHPLVLDCGANVGLSAIWFLAGWPGARLHAFEPEPNNFRLLEMNIGTRTDAVLNRTAVGRESGNALLFVADHGAMHSVKDASVGRRSIDVSCVSLGDYLRAKRIDRVDVLKLDVEGSELDAIEGLGSAIDSVHVIVGELHEKTVDEVRFYRYVEGKSFRLVTRTDAREEGAHHFELDHR